MAQLDFLEEDKNTNTDNKSEEKIVDKKIPKAKPTPKVEPTYSNKVEQAPIMSISDSPMAENVIERNGGDDILKTEPVTTNNFNEFGQVIPPSNNGSPKDFFVDPEAQIMQQEMEQMGNMEGGGDNGSTDTQPLPVGIADESSRMLADMLLDGFEMIVPEAATSYSKINEGIIRKLTKEGKLSEDKLDLIKAVNKNNKNAVKVTREQKELIKKPLYKVLEANAVKADPVTMLIIAVVAVCFVLFLQANGIKKENDSMVKDWIEKHDKTKELEKKIADLSKENKDLQKEVNDNNIPVVEAEVIG